MGNCLKKNQVNANLPQTNQTKLVKTPEEKGLQRLLSYKIEVWQQSAGKKPITISLTLISSIPNQAVKWLMQCLKKSEQPNLEINPQFSKIMPPIMIDVNQTKEKDKFGSKKYTFLINEFPKISRPFWLVVKSLPNQRYLLKQGDIFKMGKIKIRVKQIIHKNQETKDMNKQIVETQYKAYDCQANNCEGNSDVNDLKCRICMQEGQNTNPLIGICNCIGSSKYAHFKCLRQWFTIQLDPTKINMVTQINWKSLQCELCKAKLPYSIKIDNENYFLVQFPKIKKPYLVLNPVYKSNNEKSKIYYFISFKKRNRMIIGRKSDADIQLCTDVTISRHHSVIEYVEKNPNENGRFYLEDNRSKFGTVVLLNAKTSINVDPKLNGVQFQVGGDVIKISYKTQNFFQTITTKQDEIDFNAEQTQFQTREFQDEGDNQIDNVGSQEQDKKASTKQENHVLNSQDSHQQTNQILLPRNKKPLSKKINTT